MFPSFPSVKKLFCACLAAAAFAAPALAQTNTNQFIATGAGFLRTATAKLLLDSELGLMATTNSSNLAVQQYGQQLFVNDSAAVQGARNIAFSQAVALRPLNGGEQQVLFVFASLRGVQFDRAFVTFQVQHLTLQINRFDYAARVVINPVIQTFASQQLPLLQNQLLIALNLADSILGPQGTRP